MEGKGNYGYNAQTGEYGDLVETGVLDPAKVVRTALQNAASVAGLILTTDAMVAESPKEEASHGGHGHGGWVGWVAWTCNALALHVPPIPRDGRLRTGGNPRFPP